jgi:hypothetical protein
MGTTTMLPPKRTMKPPTAFPAQAKSPEPNDRKKTVISMGN